MSFIQPTINDFKTQFFRDFPFGDYQSTSVIDQDINNAIADASFNFNSDLFSDQSEYTLGFLYLTAHHLVMSLRSSSQGINGQFSWLENSKGVGSVNQSFSIPQKILDNPLFSYYTKTNYGTKYLMMILPQLIAPIFIAEGTTLPDY